MKKWTLVIVLACAQFIMVLDSTVMNVSISAVVKDLDTSVSSLQTAITFYTLTMAALMLTGGKLGDIFGRLKVFRIGSVIYGVGSLTTALAPTIGVLFVGWSIVEGLGAVLVIPAIAALIAVNYRGKDRIIGYTMIGAASGIAVALGPLIGGFLTTYLSWRYVFAGETVIMIIVLLYTLKLKSDKVISKPKLDWLSVFLSVVGMTSLVLGILQSKTWGWVTPKAIPQIGDVEIAPLGISLTAYLILIGLIVLWTFYRRQENLEHRKLNPLLEVSILKVKALRSGLAVLSGQYLIMAASFFVIPIYLQMVLGYDALKTGIKILPLSVSIVLFSALGSKLVSKLSPKKIVRMGQVALVFGALFLTGSINTELRGFMFGLSMFVMGSGLGLLVSQIGNVTMSAVDESKSSQVGGLQGTFQNLGSSLGTALIGSVMIATLTTNFVGAINSNPDISPSVQNTVQEKSISGVPIASYSEVENYALKSGLSEQEAKNISNDYNSSQIKSLKTSMFFLVILAILTIALSRNIPDKKII